MKRIKGMVLVMAAAAFLAGCGAKSSGAAMETASMEEAADAVEIYEEAPQEAGAIDSGAGPENGESVAQGRKLIKNVDLQVETTAFTDLVANIERLVNEAGGYVESSNISGSSYYGRDDRRSADFTARIPVKRLDSFVGKVEEGANVTGKREDVQDITLQYIDMESRKKSLETEQERLLELMARAEDVDAVIALESRLSEIRYEIENYGSQLRTYDNQVDFSTVYIHISEVQLLSLKQEEGTWQRIASGFSRSVVNVTRGLKEFFIGLIIALPYLICLALFGLVIWLIVRFIIKLDRKKWEKRKMTAQEEMRRPAPPHKRGGKNTLPGQPVARAEEGAKHLPGAEAGHETEGRKQNDPPAHHPGQDGEGPGNQENAGKQP